MKLNLVEALHLFSLLNTSNKGGSQPAHTNASNNCQSLIIDSNYAELESIILDLSFIIIFEEEGYMAITAARLERVYNNYRRKRRNREELIASILSSSKKRATKTGIMNKSGLSFVELNKCLNYTIGKGLIEDVYDGNYMLIVKGLEHFTQFEEISHKETEILEKKKVLAAMLETNGDAEPC